MQSDGLYTDAGEYEDSDANDSFEDGDGLEWEGEGYEDGEDEEARATYWRRERAKRIASARRRNAVARAARRHRRPPARTAAAAIRSVDLEAKVAEDSLRRDLAALRSRSIRSEYAAVAGAAVNQLMESFQPTDNAYAKAALRFAPLLLLSPQRRGRGTLAFVTDPRVIGGAAVFGLTFFGERRGKASVAVVAPPQLASGGSARFVAQVLSDKGEAVPGRTVKWDTSDHTMATVDDQGNVTGGNPGGVFIIAKVEGLPDKHIPLLVT